MVPQGNWTAVKGIQVVFSDKSKFNISSDDNRVRVWRLLGERLNPAFALQRHTAPTDGAMEPFFNKTMFASHGKSVTKMSSHFYYLSLACQAPRFASNRAYSGSFETKSWTSYEFERTRGKVTANMDRNVSRHHTELACLNSRSYRIMHSR
ncbi:transposable element Tcb1 transposase [Trichonephila clavipes]|nr:transposable element Tcb1 transposase [Trichonephila clavipes]